MKKLILGLSILTSLSFGGECGCKITVEDLHLVDGDKCPVNEVMTGHPQHGDNHQVECGKVVCHCGCMPEDQKDWE